MVFATVGGTQVRSTTTVVEMRELALLVIERRMRPLKGPENEKRDEKADDGEEAEHDG